MNDHIKVLIADDEEAARNALQSVLATFTNVQIVGNTGNPAEILPMVKTNNPGILFLDIEMPGKNGLEVADEIRTSGMNTTIVFVTAYNKFAIDAFKVSAFDYLLKPADHETIAQLLERYKTNQQGYNLEQKLDQLFDFMKNEKKIRINTRHGFHLITADEILYIESDGSYCVFHFINNKNETISINMGALEEALPVNKFFRISRSIIINLDFLDSVDRKTKTCILSRNPFSQTFKISGDRMKMLDLRVR